MQKDFSDNLGPLIFLFLAFLSLYLITDTLLVTYNHSLILAKSISLGGMVGTGFYIVARIVIKFLN
jgi:hypothetical protein